MRLAVIGSRGYPGAVQAVRYFLEPYAEVEDMVLISGGASGIDQAAEAFAREHWEPEPVILRPDYNSGPPKLAPKERNWRMMGQVGRPDQVMAIWDGYSTGTAHAIAAAVRNSRSVTIWMPGDS